MAGASSSQPCTPAALASFPVLKLTVLLLLAPGPLHSLSSLLEAGPCVLLLSPQSSGPRGPSVDCPCPKQATQLLLVTAPAYFLYSASAI